MCHKKRSLAILKTFENIYYLAKVDGSTRLNVVIYYLDVSPIIASTEKRLHRQETRQAPKTFA